MSSSAMTPPSSAQDSGHRDSSSPAWMALIVGAGALLLGLAVWAYTALVVPETERPKPAWLSVAKVTSQMTDGRMLALRVNLQLRRADDEAPLSAHLAAFASLVESAGAELNQDDLSDPRKLVATQDHMRRAINEYLADRGVSQRIRKVDFQELVLLP